MSQQTGMLAWVNKRFPLTEWWNHNATEYHMPRNINFWYFFGVFSLLVLLNQIVTGIWLTMYYVPTSADAFNSVEYIMRDVKFGWLIRYMHTTGASAFFIVVYLHMYRCIMYGSYQKPRELLWLFGMVIYVLLVAEAFTGYVLPWGQMSYWASKVIVNLASAIPLVGSHIMTWIQGDYTISQIALRRFFAFHVIAIPLLIIWFVLFHITALHRVGSNNPEGIEIKDHLDEKGVPQDSVPFHPYFTVKDLFGVSIFLIIFAAIIFFAPTFGGYFMEHANFIPANPMQTPEHIVPVWYLSPFYAILRAIPDKLFGVIAMAAAIAILFVLPWLDRSPVKSIRYKGILSKIALTIFVISFCGLGYLGTVDPTPVNTIFARIFSILYFAFFISMPFYTSKEKCKTPPDKIP